MSQRPARLHALFTDANSSRPCRIVKPKSQNPFTCAPRRPADTLQTVSALLGQRHTRQRDAILQTIVDAKGPVSIQQILERAQSTLGSLGIATVYRTLNLLLESERIQTVILPDGQTCYERAGMGHHDHFQCRRCKNVFDLEVCPLHLASGTIIPGGFLVQDHEMTLYGLCPACAPKTAKTPAPPAKKKARAK
jgi:Fur family transcriptional regulator, ferric uptake regulator